MKCYNDPYNLCSSCENNPFIFQQISINNTGIINAIEKDTQSIYAITQYGSEIISPCSFENEYVSVDLYSCYSLYMQSCSSGQLSPSFTSRINETVTSVNNTFNNVSNNGILVTGSNNLNFTMSAAEENLIHMGNMAILASLLSEQGATGSIPPILDINNNIYQLDYNSLTALSLQYFQQTLDSYHTKSNLENNLSKTDNVTTTNNCSYCDQQVPQSFSTPTTLTPDYIPLIQETELMDSERYGEPCGGVVYYIMSVQDYCGPGCGTFNCNGIWFDRLYEDQNGQNTAIPTCPQGCQLQYVHDPSCNGPNWPPAWNTWITFARCEKV